jgi:superfamily II DNA or RNA helicase
MYANTITYPHAAVNLQTHSKDVQDDLLKIPGVKLKKTTYLVPHHALAIFDSLLREREVGLLNASWRKPLPVVPSWEEVREKLLRQGEVRAEFLDDGYLMPYQKEALCFGAPRAGVHFWHPTGAGKTCSAVLWSLLAPGPVIVITRAAARFQFAREWEKFTHCRAYIMRPASTLRKNAERLESYLSLPLKRHIVISAWESFQSHVDKMMSVRPATIIWDEAHLGKSSKRWKLRNLPELPDNGRDAAHMIEEQDLEARSKGGFISEKDGNRVMVTPQDNTATAAAKLSKLASRNCATTATPVKDRVRDLWAQLDLVEPGAWGTATVWQDRYTDRKPGFYGGYDTRGQSNVDELNKRLSFVVHRIAYAETHRSLPAKRRQSVYVGVEDQAAPSAGFSKQLADAHKRGPSAILEVKLAEAASMKRKAVLGLIEDQMNSHGKVVVFTGRRKDVEVLTDSAKKNAAIKAQHATVWGAHGEMPAEARSGIVLEYMSHPGPCVLIGTGDSFGESLNMQDTDAALFVMLPYTPGQLRQWEGRFCRLGQKRPVTIYYVIAEGTPDEHVADIIIRKLPAVEKVVQDAELAEAKNALSGKDMNETPDDFANSILAAIAKAETQTRSFDASDVDCEWD